VQARKTATQKRKKEKAMKQVRRERKNKRKGRAAIEKNSEERKEKYGVLLTLSCRGYCGCQK